MGITQREAVEGKLNDMFIDLAVDSEMFMDYRFGAFQGAIRILFASGIITRREFKFLGDAARCAYSAK